MEKFGEGNKCPKCGMFVFFDKGNKECVAKDVLYVPEVKAENKVTPEHLLVTCFRCKFQWPLACIDAV